MPLIVERNLGVFEAMRASREVTRLEGKAHREGVYKCKRKVCRKQFTVTVGTIFHRSHIPLAKWILAFRLVFLSFAAMTVTS